jgi:phosphoglycolate phosphatase
MPFALIVFDLDGTLVDSAQDLADAANALLDAYGRPSLPVPTVIGMVGDGARELVRRLLAAVHLDVALDEALASYLALYAERLLNTTRPYDGMIATLEALAPVARLAILTNKPGEATSRLLEGLGLARYFAEVISGDGPLPRKPDPAGLRALMQHAPAGADDTLMVGDSRADLHAARAAGVRICLASYGFGFALISEADRREAAFVIERPSELIALVSV